MKELLSTYFSFSDDEYDAFISKSQLVEYKKHDYLIHANEHVNTLFFIRKGFVRGYRIVDGEDVTHHFFRENWFATDYESYLTGKPGELYLQALLQTTVYAFDKQILFSFYREKRNFESIRYIQAEHAYLQMVEKVKDLQTRDLKDRYNNLILKYPELLNLVSQKHIASYLGVAPQSLSRIKNTLKTSKK